MGAVVLRMKALRERARCSCAAEGHPRGMVQRYLNWNEESRGTKVVKAACGVVVIRAGLDVVYAAP